MVKPNNWLVSHLKASPKIPEAVKLGIIVPPSTKKIPEDVILELMANPELYSPQQPEYAFDYAPSQDLATELNEWFSYSTTELTHIIGGAKQTFEAVYTKLSQAPHLRPVPGKVSKWTTSKDVKRRRFILSCLDLLEHTNQEDRVRGLEAISFVVQGCFGEMDRDHDQIGWIRRNVKFLQKMAITEGVFNCLRKSLSKEWEYARAATVSASNGAANGHRGVPVEVDEEVLNKKAWNRRELKQSLTILYFMVETTRLMSEEETPVERVGLDPALESIRDELSLLQCEGGLLGYLLKNISLVRWEDHLELPLMHLLILSWKTTLLQFGNPETHLPAVKTFARVAAGLSPAVDKNMITASPLDYHMFRQDLIAKYPAYNPPKSLFAFEGPTFLPSMTEREREVRPGGNTDVMLGGKGPIENLTSILDKGVHIATPIPSPPPSPVVAGAKGQKKHNYQTNQNFPFLYPPSDDEGSAPGKKIPGKCWWRDDDADAGGVPASIKEAGDLFSSRLRTTLAMQHLWKEREAYEKYRRGWDTSGDGAENEETQKYVDPDRIPRWEESRLKSIDAVYAAALPQLQSLVIVCFKVILQSISAPPPMPPPPPPVPQNTFAEAEESSRKSGIISDPQSAIDTAGASIRTSWTIFGKARPSPSNPLAPISEASPQPQYAHHHHHHHLAHTTLPNHPMHAHHQALREAEERKLLEELDSIRMREVTSKGVTALILVLLKWFRVSHVLKFEYFTQLLLDANYIPLVLKILNGQDMVASITSVWDRPDRGYWYICNLHSTRPIALHELDGKGGVRQPVVPEVPAAADDTDDDSAPPPIARHRTEKAPQKSAPDEPAIPEKITVFSWRNFFTSINIMRILQKVVKSKAHRNLALVQYKSSVILRKPLKLTQRQLRLYTLKVFKGQVPYCGRKWRQSNMRVITSIYLHCRPDLRDDWLAGGDVDEEVGEAMPQEQALRSLTQFYNVRRWPGKMGVENAMVEEEQDFFGRELEKMRFFGGDGDVGVGVGDEDGYAEEDGEDWVGGDGGNWQ